MIDAEVVLAAVTPFRGIHMRIETYHRDPYRIIHLQRDLLTFSVHCLTAGCRILRIGPHLMYYVRSLRQDNCRGCGSNSVAFMLSCSDIVCFNISIASCDVLATAGVCLCNRSQAQISLYKCYSLTCRGSCSAWTGSFVKGSLASAYLQVFPCISQRLQLKSSCIFSHCAI